MENGVKSIYILGMKYDLKQDTFSFEGFDPHFVVPYTKRSCLSFLAQLYDPLGFISPFIMYNKFSMKYLWAIKSGWDDTMPDHLALRFQTWLDSSHLLKEWSLPRCYFLGQKWNAIQKIEVHGFCDASELGYGG